MKTSVALVLALVLGLVVPASASERKDANGQGVRTPQVSRVADHAKALEAGLVENAVLPAIRRVGIDLPGHNVGELRKYLNDQVQVLKGVASLPMSNEDLTRALQESLAAVVRKSGRFWLVSFDPVVDGVDGQQSGSYLGKPFGSKLGTTGATAKALLDAKARLTRDYDLDAWIESEIVLAPDATQVRLILRQSSPGRGAKDAPQGSSGSTSGSGIGGGHPSILAREDVQAPAQATSKDLELAFEQGIQRILSTLGHDGKVTFGREDLVTVDFGLEKGLAPGSKLKAGLVLLQARHPVTGEFMRVRRVESHVLEVVEAKQGSALCRVVAIHDVVYRELLAELKHTDAGPEPVLLAWLPRDELFQHSSETNALKANSMPMPLVTSVPLGFAESHSLKRKAKIGSEKSPKSASKRHGVEHVPTPEMQAQSSGENSEEDDKEQATGEPTYDNPASWKISHVRVGLGVSLGVLETPKGDRNTDFPDSILNLVAAQGHVRIDKAWSLHPQMSVAYFRGGDVVGQALHLSIPALTPVWQSEDGNDTGFAGAGVSVGIGTAQARYLRPTAFRKALTEIGIDAEGEYVSRQSAFGLASGVVSLNCLALLKGEFAGSLGVSIEPSKFLPHELSFMFRLITGPDAWTEYSFGAAWEFLK